MTGYVTGGAIRALREKKGFTQKQLAERLMVSDKAVSKWETGRGLPDVTLLEPLAAVLGVSVAELLSGACVSNRNRSANLLAAGFTSAPCAATCSAPAERGASAAAASGCRRWSRKRRTTRMRCARNAWKTNTTSACTIP